MQSILNCKNLFGYQTYAFWFMLDPTSIIHESEVPTILRPFSADEMTPMTNMISLKRNFFVSLLGNLEIKYYFSDFVMSIFYLAWNSSGYLTQNHLTTAIDKCEVWNM